MRQNNLAKQSEPISGYHGIHCTKEPITDEDTGKLLRHGIYKAISPTGRLEGKFANPKDAAKLTDELMVDEYFHRESDAERFYPFAFIAWNDEDIHPDVSEAVSDM